VARQRGTSRRQVGSNGRSGAVGVTSRGELGGGSRSGRSRSRSGDTHDLCPPAENAIVVCRTAIFRRLLKASARFRHLPPLPISIRRFRRLPPLPTSIRHLLTCSGPSSALESLDSTTNRFRMYTRCRCRAAAT